MFSQVVVAVWSHRTIKMTSLTYRWHISVSFVSLSANLAGGNFFDSRIEISSVTLRIILIGRIIECVLFIPHFEPKYSEAAVFLIFVFLQGNSISPRWISCPPPLRSRPDKLVIRFKLTSLPYFNKPKDFIALTIYRKIPNVYGHHFQRSKFSLPNNFISLKKITPLKFSIEFILRMIFFFFVMFEK